MTTAGLLLAACAGVALHLLVPPSIEESRADSSPTKQPRASTNQARPTVDPASLMQVAAKDIRQRLFDPPVAAPKPPPPKPLPPIELISTILRDNGEHSAWVRDGQTTRKVAVGDKLGPEDNPAVVQSIAADKLVVLHEAKAVELGQTSSNGGRR